MTGYMAQYPELIFIAVVGLLLIASPFTQRLVGRLALRFAIKTESVVDDLVVDALRPFRFVYVFPAVTAFSLADWMSPYEYQVRLVSGLVLIFLGVETSIKILGAAAAVIRHRSGAKGVSSTGYIDLLKILSVLVGLALAASVTLDTEVSKIIAGLGAATAVAGFIFRDTLQSLFVGIKIASFDLIREGDWLSIPSYDADGMVEHIGLYDIKIRNWDQTTSLIPTHRVLEVANRNYSSMQNDAKARQLVAKFMFDIKSIHSVSSELLEKLKNTDLIATEVAERSTTLEQAGLASDSSSPNTDIGTNYDLFCIYVDRYLRSRKDLHQKRYYILVRTLEPTNHGLPMQIFAYSRKTGMVEFSDVQSSIFSHLIATATKFDLKLFQFREEE